MTCPQCAAELEDGARFCGACGSRIAPETGLLPVAESAPTPTPPGGPAATPPARSGNLGLDVTMLAVPTPAPPGLSSSGARPGSTAATPTPPPVRVSAPAPVQAPAADALSTFSPSLTMRPSVPAAPSPAAETFSGYSRAASAPPYPAAAPSISGTTTAISDRPERKSENSGSRDDMVGRTLNKRYVVGEKVGEGGFGAVFRGKQLATGRDVALKILHPYNLTDKTIVARFRREAEACSRLRNPHTVITYDFDETEDGVLYLAMELLHGRSLHHLERAEGTLDPDRVLHIIDQVAEALGEAHQNGIVHRDMKPENVFIERRGDEDYVKVLDFGIAKVMADDRGQVALTAVGQTLGTLEFMSPEQLRGMPLDGRSDIYALGIMAYEMLTGQLPFKDARTPVQIINFHMQKPAPAPSRLSPGLQIPGYVDEVILKMVAKSRDDRYADTNALRAHIARVLRGADSRANRFEAYRVVTVVGAVAVIISTVVYLLSR